MTARHLMPALDLCQSRGINLTKSTRSSDSADPTDKVLVHPALERWRKGKENGRG